MDNGKPDTGISKVLYATFIFICLIAATFAMTMTDMGLGTWEPRLHIPSWGPSLFGLMFLWICDFLALAIAGARIWKQEHRRARLMAFFFWICHLGTILIWFYLFFAVKTVLGALIAAGMLLFFATMLLRYGRLTNSASTFYLLVNLTWVLYTFLLNASIFLLTWLE